MPDLERSEATVTVLPSIPPREVTIVRATDAVPCAVGHRIPRQGVLGHTWLRCLRATDAGTSRQPCGELVYVVNLRNGLLAVVRLDWREAEHIEKMQMSVAEVAEFLQLPWRAGMS